MTCASASSGVSSLRVTRAELTGREEHAGAHGRGNRVALIADPLRDKATFTAIIKIFNAHGKTPTNTRQDAFELFHVPWGSGIAHCNGETFPITRSDRVVVRPGHAHMVENPNDERPYRLTVMMANEGLRN